MDLAHITTCSLLSIIKEEQWEYRPRDNMRSLIELARHLVHVPALELAILREQSKEQVRGLVISVMHHHRGQLFTYMKQLDIPISMFDLYGPASNSWKL
jgi:uncharacterized damage-inducible protein DinB